MIYTTNKNSFYDFTPQAMARNLDPGPAGGCFRQVTLYQLVMWYCCRIKSKTIPQPRDTHEQWQS
jgi:hypothetical protein